MNSRIKKNKPNKKRKWRNRELANITTLQYNLPCYSLSSSSYAGVAAHVKHGWGADTPKAKMFRPEIGSLEWTIKWHWFQYRLSTRDGTNLLILRLANSWILASLFVSPKLLLLLFLFFSHSSSIRKKHIPHLIPPHCWDQIATYRFF